MPTRGLTSLTRLRLILCFALGRIAMLRCCDRSLVHGMRQQRERECYVGADGLGETLRMRLRWRRDRRRRSAHGGKAPSSRLRKAHRPTRHDHPESRTAGRVESSRPPPPRRAACAPTVVTVANQAAPLPASDQRKASSAAAMGATSPSSSAAAAAFSAAGSGAALAVGSAAAATGVAAGRRAAS